MVMDTDTDTQIHSSPKQSRCLQSNREGREAKAEAPPLGRERATVAMNLHVVHENRDLQFVVADCQPNEVQPQSAVKSHPVASHRIELLPPMLLLLLLAN